MVPVIGAGRMTRLSCPVLSSAPRPTMASLAGKTVVFTGTLQTKRAAATAAAVSAGATVAGAVSGKTDVLVAGAGAGAKMEAARAKGVAVWDEQHFLRAVARAPKTGAAAAKRKPPAPAAAPPAKKPKRGAGAEAGEGEWSHYGNGGWNEFSGPATAWLEGAVASNSAEVVEERRDGPKKASSDRRIIRDPAGAEDTARRRFYIVKAPLLKRLKEM